MMRRLAIRRVEVECIEVFFEYLREEGLGMYCAAGIYSSRWDLRGVTSPLLLNHELGSSVQYQESRRDSQVPSSEYRF